MTLVELARGFGLTAEEVAGATRLHRDTRAVTLRTRLCLDTSDARHHVLAACLGTRLGLDLLAQEAAAPSDAGLARLLPAAAVSLAEAISGAKVAARPWVNPRFVVVVIHEVGRAQRLRTLTPGWQEAFEAATRALFYETYRVRRVRQHALRGGTMHEYGSTGGLGSAVATLFPDFDLDAARERGAFFVADYDRFFVWRPDGAHSTAALREFARDVLRESPLAFSRRIYYLRPDGVVLGETCDARSEFDATALLSCLDEVSQ